MGRSSGGRDATGGARSATTPEDGGVTVLSKWPIVRKEQYIHKDAYGSDLWRFGLFYVDSVVLPALLPPYTSYSADQSPFVTVMEKLSRARPV